MKNISLNVFKQKFNSSYEVFKEFCIENELTNDDVEWCIKALKQKKDGQRRSKCNEKKI